MADICYLCQQRKSDEDDWNIAYEDCYECENPTCEEHGREVMSGERFYCYPCIEEIGNR